MGENIKVPESATMWHISIKRTSQKYFSCVLTDDERAIVSKLTSEPIAQEWPSIYIWVSGMNLDTDQ